MYPLWVCARPLSFCHWLDHWLAECWKLHWECGCCMRVLHCWYNQWISNKQLVIRWMHSYSSKQLWFIQIGWRNQSRGCSNMISTPPSHTYSHFCQTPLPLHYICLMADCNILKCILKERYTVDRHFPRSNLFSQQGDLSQIADWHFCGWRAQTKFLFYKGTWSNFVVIISIKNSK